MKLFNASLFAATATAFAGLYGPDFAKTHHARGNETLAERSAQINCSNIPSYLTQDDCNYLSSIGLAGVGWGDGNINVGSDGDLFFVLNNASPGQDLIVLFWYGDKQWINANAPVITLSLPAGASMDVALADNGWSGGFGAIYAHQNTLNGYGQLWNTVGEFSTGTYRTFDVSREVDMYGSWLQIDGDNGCNAEWSGFSQCCFTCSTLDKWNGCETGYWLDNCYEQTSTAYNPGAHSDNGLTSGGCGGWARSANVRFL